MSACRCKSARCLYKVFAYMSCVTVTKRQAYATGDMQNREIGWRDEYINLGFQSSKRR